jgi:hypothetical protein
MRAGDLQEATYIVVVRGSPELLAKAALYFDAEFLDDLSDILASDDVPYGVTVHLRDDKYVGQLWFEGI